jgi:hypothetical protein
MTTSKELIEQLAKDLFHNVSVIEKWVAKGSPDRFGKVNGERKHILTFEATLEELEAFAKACQAAAPNGYIPNNFFNWLDAYCLGMVITQQSLRDEYTKMLSCPDAAPIDNVAEALETLSKAMQNDLDFAWSWHCNIAMTAQDSGAPHKEANERTADFMARAFGVNVRDTSMYKALIPDTQAKKGE